METATNGHRSSVSVKDLSVTLYEKLAPLTPYQRGVAKFLLGLDDRTAVLAAVADMDEAWNSATARQRELTLKAVRNDLPMGRVSFTGRPKPNTK